jgi:GTPase SAR1 family protein
VTQKELLEVIADAAKRGSKRLDLSFKGLTSLPPEIGSLTNLTALDLFDNQFTALPPEIGNLTNLTTLDLDGNQLTALPPEIGNLTNLTALSLDGNQLTVMPPEVGNLTGLTALCLYDNQLTALPPEIGSLTNLTALYLYSNKLTILPSEIGELTNLTALYLNDNQLTALPPEIGGLTNLTTLYLQGNRLTALPPEIGNLTSLATLRLGGNQLTFLPSEIGNLTKLTTLDLSGSRLATPPPEIVEQGTRAILEYLRARLKKGRRQWVSKLIVVGQGEVGKTAMLRSLKGLPFDPNVPTTHGITIEQLKFKHPTERDITMQLNAWDFGGQEIYHATHQFFLTNQSLFVLVWNARMGWEQSKLYYWLDSIKARAPESPVILVATRAEEHQPVLPLADIEARYPQVRESLATSNQTGAGIEELREAIAEHAATLPRMGEEWPASWLSAAEDIRTQPAKYTDPQTLDSIMVRHNVEPSARATLSTALHELGDILFFRDDEELKDFIVLKPEWVSEYVCKVLDDPDVKEREGILTRELRDQLWKDLDEPMRDHFLRLMEKFDLSYRTLENREISLVVERLQLDPPVGWSELWDQPKQAECCREVTVRYRLPSDLPPGVPTWFIARSHRFTMHTHWRSGAVFADDPKNWRQLALVNANPQARTLELSVRGPMPHNFLALLRDGFELTLSRYPGLVVERFIPCPGHDGKPCSHEFRFADLEARLARMPPRDAIECPVGFEDVSVPQMLFGVSWETTEGVVLKRLGEFSDHLHTRFDQLDAAFRTMESKFEDLRQLSQRQFLLPYSALQRDVDARCPNVFVLRPLERGGWLGQRLGMRLELQFYCQAPGHWHPTTEGGRYEISAQRKWLKAVAQHIAGMVKVLKYAAPSAASRGGGGLTETNRVASNDTKFMMELVKTLLGKESLPVADDRLHDPASARGAAMRAIRAFLDAADPDVRRLGLKLVLTPEGHYLWLCEHHAREYEL